MQLLVTHADPMDMDPVEIKCPGCDSLLKTTREQDWRVHIMLHPEAKCRWSNQKLRVDRLSGYAEPWPEVKEEVCEPTTADGTRTSITTSGKTPCTTFRSVTRHTPRATPAGALGRIRR